MDFRSDTPLIRLGRYAGTSEIWLKAEHLQPTGALEDRVAAAILDARAPGSSAVVAGSGSACLAFASVAARRGIRLKAVCPAATIAEHIALLRRHAVELQTDASSLAEAQKVAEGLDETLVYGPLDRSTAPYFEPFVVELSRQAAAIGADTIVLPAVALGLVAAMTNVAAFEGSVTFICAQDAGSGDLIAAEAFAGSGMGAHRCEETTAYECRRRLGTTEGLLVGYGSAAAVELAAAGSGRAIAVAVDAGDRYFSRDGLREAAT